MGTRCGDIRVVYLLWTCQKDATAVRANRQARLGIYYWHIRHRASHIWLGGCKTSRDQRLFYILFVDRRFPLDDERRRWHQCTDNSVDPNLTLAAREW